MDFWWFNLTNRFARKNFFRSVESEMCRKSPFLQILFGFFPNISLFFHTKTLLITIPTIKLFSIVKKTDFWSRNFLKIAGTANFCRKNGISWISRAVLDIFSWNFAHWCKMVRSKMWRSAIFKKKIFHENRNFLDSVEIILGNYNLKTRLEQSFFVNHEPIT